MRAAEETMRSLARYLELTRTEKEEVERRYHDLMRSAQFGYSDYEESALTFAHAVEQYLSKNVRE